MNMPWDLHEAMRNFGGRTPLFPLPNVVLLPHVLLPMHIFEPRYREMVADVLANDRLLAMALLKPGWEAIPDSTDPPIHETVCLGYISAEERLEDGRYYLILQGLTRARILAETEDDRPYRTAELELCPDYYPQVPTISRENRKMELLSEFRRLLPNVDESGLFHQALDAETPLGAVCDVLASALRLEPEQTQQILSEVNVDLRSDVLLNRIRELARPERSTPRPHNFPPPFSDN